MPSNIRDIGAAKAKAASDNTKIDPVDLLKMVIEDIEDGEINADGLVVIYVHRPEEGDNTVGLYRCGMRDYFEELGIVRIAEQKTVDNARGISSSDK